MIKAEDLRIGNLVQTPKEKADVIIEIGFKETKENKRDYYVICENTQGYFIENKGVLVIKPIPLTEEWLLKFGFEKDEFLENYFVKGDFMYWVLMNEVIYHKEEGMSGANHFVKSIFYVHDFQNLYKAITNKELTIKE